MSDRTDPPAIARRTVLAAAVAAATLVPAACASSTRHAEPRPTGDVDVDVPRFDAAPSGALGAGPGGRLQRVLDGVVADGACSSAMAAALTLGGRWSGASGIDRPGRGAARATDVVPLAEISRMFTAALVLRLAQDHRIALDAPLAAYLDGRAAAAANGATVRQALALRAGLPDLPDAVRQRLTETPDVPPTIADVDAAIPSAIATPGGDANVSDPTYVLLARAAERAGGAPFADLVRRELIIPSGVSGILVAQAPPARTPGRWALPSGPGSWGAGGSLPSAADAIVSAGASSMAGDLPTLVEWTWRLLQGRVLPGSAVDVMARTDETGLGSGLDRLPPPLPDGSLGHIGGKPGFTTLLVIVPIHRIVIAVALAAENGPVERVGDALLHALR